MTRPFSLISPLGTADVHQVYGRAEKKPWDYAFTAAIPHLNTLESLRACIELVRLQSIRPYLMVVDTGSPPDVCAKLEKLRAPDLEIHYLAGHGYRHSSEPVTAALDVAQTLCRTPHLFNTHSDVFLRRRDFAESLLRVCNANTPAIGYRMSPREWVTRDWEWMVGHTATMLYMPSIHRAGATWSYQRMHYQFDYPWQQAIGWPDTETGFNCTLREAGIVPVFIGNDRNGERQIDDNIDHVRSFPGSKVYSPKRFREANGWMKSALRDAALRARDWRKQVSQDETH